jgi:hypothetical protein
MKTQHVNPSQYGISIIGMSAFHDPRARAFDFCLFTLASDAISNVCIASCTICMSSGRVRITVASSAYATSFVRGPLRQILTPGRRCSSCGSGLIHIVKITMLRGHPLAYAHRMDIFLVVVPFIWTVDVALL